MRKLESRNSNGSTNNSNTNQFQTMRINSSNNDNINGSSVAARRNLQRNGTNSSAGGASSVGTTSDDGEESSSVPDDEDDFQNVSYLSSIEPPVVSEIQSHTALITWEPPAAPTSTDNALTNLNVNEILYQILLGDRGKDGKYKSIFRGTNLSCRIEHLRAGQDYYVSLVANHGEVSGETTEPVLFTTPAREPDTPSQPKLFSKTKNSLQLRWNAPNDNGAPIQYILEMNSEAEHDFTEIVKTKAKQFTVSKLQPATWYKFRLAAMNDFGRSDYSVPIGYVTDGYPPPPPLPPKLHNLTTSSIALSWFRRREDGDFILQMAHIGLLSYQRFYGEF
jgi:fibronectin type III domain-containing protein 3